MIQEVPIAYKHLEVEKEFTKLCKDKGYNVVDLSYHHNYSDETAAQLRRDFSPASLSVRVNPDMLIQREETGYQNNYYKSFFVELKTGNNKNAIQLEAYQLMQNKVKEKYMQTPCLYVYIGKFSDNKMIACNASLIRGSRLVVPQVNKNLQIKYLLQNFFAVPVEERDYIRGFSNDPFVEVTDISNWQPVEYFI